MEYPRTSVSIVMTYYAPNETPPKYNTHAWGCSTDVNTSAAPVKWNWLCPAIMIILLIEIILPGVMHSTLHTRVTIAGLKKMPNWKQQPKKKLYTTSNALIAIDGFYQNQTRTGILIGVTWKRILAKEKWATPTGKAIIYTSATPCPKFLPPRMAWLLKNVATPCFLT